MKKLAIAGAVAAAAFAAPAFAQSFYAPPPQSWYLDLGIGQAKLRDGGDFIDDKKTMWAVRLGYRFHPNIAVDVGYYDFGTYNFNLLGVQGDVKAHSFGASLVAIAPLDQFDIYGRIGYARSEAKASGGGTSDKEKENEMFYGVGAHWNFAPQWGVLLEYQRQDKLKIDSWMLGATLRF